MGTNTCKTAAPASFTKIAVPFCPLAASAAIVYPVHSPERLAENEWPRCDDSNLVKSSEDPQKRISSLESLIRKVDQLSACITAISFSHVVNIWKKESDACWPDCAVVAANNPWKSRWGKAAPGIGCASECKFESHGQQNSTG